MRKGKRALALTLSTVLAFGNALPAAAQPGEEMSSQAELLARYPLFSDAGDASGNGNDAAVVGDKVTFGEHGMFLPGGKSDSNYAELPGDMFVGEDSLTISSWIKSETQKGNYTALFFGTGANSGKVPENYWLFNPANPSGQFKSVFTNSVNAGSPWTTEVGVSGAETEQYYGKWAHYTTVITPTSVTGYINGEKVGSTQKERTVTDFGDTLQAYIGRSNYLADPSYKGTFQDVRVYRGAMEDIEVAELYADAETASSEVLQVLLEDAKQVLTLGDLSAVNTNISLPSEGKNHAQISWATSDPSVVDEQGNVFLSAEAKTATLTATLQIGDQGVQKEFPVTTLPESEVDKYVLEKLRLPYTLSEFDTLPSSVEGRSVTWICDTEGVLDENSAISGAESGWTDVTLTANVDFGNDVIRSKNFAVRIMENGGSLLAGYIKNGGTQALSKSLHLGLSQDGQSFEALNHNTGVLFTKTPQIEVEGHDEAVLTDPYLFRMADGTFGVMGLRSYTSGVKEEDNGKVQLFLSSDLISYEEAGSIDLKIPDANKGGIANPQCEYDASAGCYVINWRGEDSEVWTNTIADFSTLTCYQEAAQGGGLIRNDIDTGIAGAITGNVIPVTKDEAKLLQNRLGEVVNTGVSLSENEISTPLGVLPDLSGQNAIASYSDGQQMEKRVEWDLSSIDVNRPGTYKVTGTISQYDQPFPVIENRADPNVLQWKGKYYFIATDEGGQNKIYMRCADTIEGLKDAKDTLILDKTASGDGSGCLWAPELHQVGEDLYIFLATSTTGQWDAVQCRTMKLNDVNADPMHASNWGAPQRVLKKDGSYLYEEGITLDMTYFEINGISYVCWAQRQINPTWASNLMLATVDPSNPTQLTSDPVLICEPDYGWDRNTTAVDEGPFLIQNENGEIFITFSGSNVDTTYCVGYLKCVNMDNLLNRASWEKCNYPILTSQSQEGELGPGHNSYVMDADGNYVNVYHAKASSSSARSTGFRIVYWNTDKSPRLDMTTDKEILPEHKQVSIDVTVEAGEDAEVLDKILNKVEIKNAGDIRENLTLPVSQSGVELSWSSNREEIISTQAVQNENYYETPAGTVNRQAADEKVILTVSGTYGTATYSRDIEVTVKAKSGTEPYVGYLYAHFNEYAGQKGEQDIFFGLSKDGLNWTALNDNKAVLSSQYGDKKVRDPYIIRSHEGDKFYLIATDLDIYSSRYGNVDWGLMSTQGSQNLIIWESTDLINWTNHRSVTVSADIEAGNTWAPEAIYDDKTGEYLVYWSSKVKTDGYDKHRIYVCKTRDFYTFTEPQPYSGVTDEDDYGSGTVNGGNIDASIFKEGDTYYRLIKNDSSGNVMLQSSKTLLSYGDEIESEPIGDTQSVNLGSVFKRIDNSAAGCLETFKGYYEGATMFKFNDQEKWCIMVDEYGGKARGYIPFITEDLDKPNHIKMAKDNTYLMPDAAKHGTIIPITQKEYDALAAKWGTPKQEVNQTEQEEPVLKYDFEEELKAGVIEDKSGNELHAAANGNAKYQYDSDKKSNVLYLDGDKSTFAELPKGFFDGLDNMTVSFDIKPETTDNFHFDFALGQDTTRYLFTRVRDKEVRTAITTRGNGQEKDVLDSSSGRLNKWMNITLVMENHKLTMYIDGRKVSVNEHVRSISELGSSLKAYLGKSFYPDPMFKGSYDNVMVYNRALTDKEIVKTDATEVAQSLIIPKYISQDLQSEINGEKITWTCDKEDVITEDGKVTLPKAGQGSQQVTLTAKAGEITATGKAEVLEYGGSILTYVSKGNDLLAYEDSRRSDALYVAAKYEETGSYEELNKGKAILYVKWNGDQKTQPNWQMGSPGLFRKADGSFGVIASANNGEAGIYVWDCKDQVTFENERYIKLNTKGIAVKNPVIFYDNAAEKYKVFWEGGNGVTYLTALDTLDKDAKDSQTISGYYNRSQLTDIIPESAVREEAAAFTMTKSEYEAFLKKYETLHNTGIESVEMEVKQGDTLTMPKTVKAQYNDGTDKNLGVKWNQEDLDKVDTTKPGTYEINGEVQQDAFGYPFISERADPHIFYNEDDGYYYATGSHYPESDPDTWVADAGNCYRAIGLRRAETMAGLKEAEESLMFAPDLGDKWGSFIWAPEFHKINGTWYCLVGAHDFGAEGIPSDDAWGWCSKSILIPYIGDGDESTSIEEDMKAGGMLSAEQWGEPIVLEGAPSFDVSYYYDEDNDQGYYILPNTPSGARISIVKAQKEGVPQFDGEKKEIKAIEWPWEYGVYEGSVTDSNPEGNDQGIVEGPYLFEYGDKIYISYSGATVDKYYCLGLMMADKGSDIMNPDSWTNVDYPMLSSYDTVNGDIGGVAHVGGGHNSFVIDEYGNIALIYHARPYPDPHTGKEGAGGLFDPCRQTMVKSVNVAYDGTLVLNMTAEEELNPANKNIKATVTVEGQQPTEKEYTVTFVDKDGNVLKTEKVKEGQAATAPEAPKVEGYEFTGWSEDFSEVTKDITVQAQYKEVGEPTEKEYTVTFVDKEGIVLRTEKVKEGQTATAPEAPKVEGYEFTGWSEDFSKVTKDLTVKAQYEKVELPKEKEYTVTFVDKDGNVLKTEKVNEGQSATAPKAPKVEGYEFTGWSQEFSKITRDMMVKALYTKAETPKTPEKPQKPEEKGQWIQNAAGWWYQNEDGTWPKEQWRAIHEKWYAFDENGYMRTGWYEQGGTWYYLDPQNGDMETGWVNDSETWYYMSGNGSMQFGWVNDNDKWYYLNNSGAMVTGWQVVNGNWYYMTRDGSMQTGWVNDSNIWYYMSNSGSMQFGWIYDNDKWYYLNNTGAMATGWTVVNGNWYYMASDGSMQTGWLLENGIWYYLNSSGALEANNWIGNYYVNRTGAWTRTR